MGRLRLFARFFIFGQFVTGLICATPDTASATCNLGQDAKIVSFLEFGTLGIAGFPPGSLQLLQQKAINSSDYWRFALRPPAGVVEIRFATRSRTVAGHLRLRRPITGLLHETIDEGTCRRTMEIDDNALQDDVLSVESGEIPGNIRGEFVLSHRTFTILENKNLGTGLGGGPRLLRLSGTSLEVSNASITLPGAGTIIADLHAVRPFDFLLHLDTLRATLLDAEMSTSALSFAGPIDMTVNGLRISADTMAAAKATVTISKERSRLSFHTVRFTAASLAFHEIGEISLSNITSIVLGNLKGDATITAGVPILDTQTSEILDASLKAAEIRIENAKAERLMAGGGSVDLSKLSSDDIYGSISIDKPDQNGFETAALKALFARVKISISGRRSDPKVVARGTLSRLQLGTLTLLNAQMPFEVARTNDTPPSVKFEATRADITVAHGEIRGTLFDAKLSGALSNISSFAETRLAIPRGGLTGHLQAEPIRLALFGGHLITGAAGYQVKNDDELVFGVRTRAKVGLGEANLAVEGVTMSPAPGSPDLTVQSQLSYSGPHAKLGLTLDPLARFPLLITAHFDIPGFSLALGTIPLEVGPLEVDFTSIAVSKFSIDIWGTTAALSLHGLSIGVGDFRPRKLRPGETTVPLDLRGHASTPFSIDRLSGFFELLPLPPAFAELAVYRLHFGAQNLSYAGPSNLSVQTTTVDIDVPHAWVPTKHLPPHTDPFVSVKFDAGRSNVAWNGAPNGTADIDKINVDLAGQTGRLNGKIHLAASTIALSGRADIPLSTEPDGNNGCTLTVPANVGFSMFDVDGTLDVINQKPLGQIKVDKFNLGHLSYFGHQECRWSQEASFDVPPYPCDWVWGIPTDVCTTIKFDIGWVFAVEAVDMHIRPAVVIFDVADDGKFQACKYSLAELYPIVPPVFQIAPQIPMGGEVARWLNDLTRIAVGGIEFLLTTGAINLTSAISLIDFASHGNGLNYKSDCKP